ncbi:MAG: hypothetical protein ACOCWA_09975, partial [Bacteroidota bacterium]
MKKIIFTLISIIWIFSTTNGQYSVVLIDSMKTGGEFIDNNLLVTPDGYDAPIRGFKITERTGPDDGLTFPAAAHTDTMMENAGLTNFFLTFDYEFPREIDRTLGDTIMIEFDLNFELLAGSGEAGRMNITLLQNLPEGGITTEDFGIPAYHFWLFNGSYGPCLSYGGEFEDNPGWNGGAGGYYYNENAADPNSATTYTSTDNYPLVPYSKEYNGAGLVSNTKWIHYTWIIAPQMMHLYYRDADKGPEENEEIVFMAIPESESDISFINEKHGTFEASMPPAYTYYETVNGLRFFNRGAGRNEGDNNFYVSNLSVKKTGTPLSTYSEFQRAGFRIKEDIGTYDLPVTALNIPDGEEVSVKVEYQSGAIDHIDNWLEGTLVFTNDGIKPLPIPIVNTTKTENDTIIFAITEVTGGYYPTTGPNNTFELIIRPAEGSTGLNDHQMKKLNIIP